MTYEDDYPVTSGTKTTLKKESKPEKEAVTSKVLTVKPKKAVAALTKTVPLVLSFSEGPLAGTIKFVKAGDTYQDNMGKIQRYSVTKVVIKTTAMKDPFTMTEPLYRFFLAAIEDTDAQEKIADWNE